MVIAGSDSSGGAGIQADIKTITSLGSYAMTAITTITSQNTKGVKDILSLNPKNISNQIEYTAKDIKPDAIKIGLLNNEKTVSAVSRSLKKIKITKIILDPVIVSTSGVQLVNNKCIDAIKKNLFKNVSLLTPNIPEAKIISGINISNVDDMIVAAKNIIKLGPKNILIKGGHLNSNYIVDVLVNKKFIKLYKNKKIKSRNTHGTGCTLSSAIATYYSYGKNLKKSCHLAIKYVNGAIKTAPNYGKGNGPINHLYNKN